jgi:hypothetical protein
LPLTEFKYITNLTPDFGAGDALSPASFSHQTAQSQVLFILLAYFTYLPEKKNETNLGTS